MKNLCNCSFFNKAAQFFRKIAGYTVVGDYHMNLAVYAEEQSESPECAHQLNGSVHRNLWRLLAYAGGVLLFCSVIRMLCGLCRMEK